MERQAALTARSAVIATLLSLVLFVTPSPTSAATAWIYPGGCAAPQPSGSLQQCINNAAAGDAIEVRTNALITGVLLINKSIAILAGAGFQPSVELSGSIGLSSGTGSVIIQGIDFGDRLVVETTGGSDHAVLLDDVTARGNANDPAIGIDAEVSTNVDITRSHPITAGEGAGILAVDTHATGTTRFRFVANRVTGDLPTFTGAGIDVVVASAGPTRLDIDNNTVFDHARCTECDARAALRVVLEAGPDTHVNVVGNTIEKSGRDALRIDESLPAGDHADVRVFNNIFSRAQGAPVRINAGGVGDLVYRAGFNDAFGNGVGYRLDGYSAGAGNLSVNPRFVDAVTGDLRLKATSSLLDRGIVCSPGGVAYPDAAGNDRSFAASVDMGAYERGASDTDGAAFVGTSGPDVQSGTTGNDIFCGLGGEDVLNGTEGNDWIDGGKGPDRLTGGTGADRMFGAAGDDQLCAKDASGTDVVDGGPGTDRYGADAGDVLRAVEQTGGCAV